MSFASGCNARYQENIVNLNRVKRKIYDDFNNFNHQDPPTTDPIEQRNALTWVMDNVRGLSPPEKLVLGKIVRETVCRGFYYTYISQQKIADELEISRRSVVYAIKKLQELDWIAIKQSDRKPYRNITDFNIEKLMALGEKYSKRKKSQGEKDRCAPHAQHKSTLKDSSNEESNCSPEIRTTEGREKLRAKISHKKKPHKIRRTTGSLALTWISAWNDASPGNVRKLFLSKSEMFKLSTILGNKRVRGKWRGSTEDLHEFVEWSIAHWEYLRYRQSWAKKAPIEPNIGWFVYQIAEIQGIWREETETNPKEPEIDQKIKWKKRRAERWNTGQGWA